MVIMWDLIAKTRKTKINSMLRSCTKGIRDCTIQSENRFFQVYLFPFLVLLFL